MHTLTRTAGLLVCLALALPAQAEEPSEEEKAEAKDLFAEGVALFKEGQHAQALASFRKSYKIRPHWRLHLNIGLCYKELSMFTKARAEFDAFILEGTGELDAASLKLVNAELKKLESIIAVLDIEILTKEATVELDGKDVGDMALEGPVEVDPGSHVLKATLEGEVFYREEFLVSKGERRSFEISIEEPEEEIEPAPDEPAPEAKAKKKKTRPKKSPAVWVMGALTLALTATAITTGGLAVKKHGELEDLDSATEELYATEGYSDAAHQDYLDRRKPIYDSGKALGYATTVFIIAAGAALASTIVVGVLTRRKTQEQDPSLAISPVLLESGGMLVVAGSF